MCNILYLFNFEFRKKFANHTRRVNHFKKIKCDRFRFIKMLVGFEPMIFWPYEHTGLCQRNYILLFIPIANIPISNAIWVPRFLTYLLIIKLPVCFYLEKYWILCTATWHVQYGYYLLIWQDLASGDGSFMRMWMWCILRPAWAH